MPSPRSTSEHVVNLVSSPSIVASNQHSVDTAYGGGGGPKASLRSCITCRRRKVKCNKEAPCSNCTRNGATCIFPPPGRARPTPRGRRSEAGQSSVILRPAQHLPPQVRRLQDNESETLDDRARRQARTSAASPGPRSFRGLNDTASSREQWIERCLYFGERPPKPLYQIGSPSAASRDNGGDVYASCLARLTRLLAESPGSVPNDDAEEEDVDEASDNGDSHSVDRPVQTTPTNPDLDSYMLGCNPPDDGPGSMHPSPSEIPFYWQTFVENVDPLIKLFHVPSMTKTVREIQRNLRSLTPSEDALMFAIYFAAVTSMTPDEAQELLGKDKEILVARYRMATKKALARAEFVSSSDLMTLQAAVLFLFSFRESDQSRFTWNMTALTVRVAQSLGIHRVRRDTDLTPYDAEISLRLWLNIWLLDLRTALDQGTDVLIPGGTPDMILPLNINDTDLDPGGSEYPPPRVGMTDMAPTLVKYEMGLLMKRLGQVVERGRQGEQQSALNQGDMEQMAASCKRQVEEQYLQNCADDNGFQVFTAFSTRLFFAEVPLLIYHPILSSDERSTISLTTRDTLLETSIKTIECSFELIKVSPWPHWARQPCTHVHWHAISVILEELAVRSDETQIVQKAWNAVKLAIECWGSSTQQDELWKPLMRLVKKAKRMRDANESLSVQDTAETDHDASKVPMPIDWAMTNPLAPSQPWPAEFSTAFLYQDMDQDFMLDSVGSPSEILD